MRNLLIGLFTIAILASCGGTSDSTIEIKTDDIQGSIQAPKAKKTMLTHSGDITSDGVILEFKDKGEISIYLSKKGLKATSQDIENSMFYEDAKIEQQDDALFFEYTDKPMADEEAVSGYAFILIRKYGENYVHLKGKGGNLHEPIKDKATAEELLKIARTFKSTK